jgi:hypothetical protein
VAADVANDAAEILFVEEPFGTRRYIHTMRSHTSAFTKFS